MSDSIHPSLADLQRRIKALEDERSQPVRKGPPPMSAMRGARPMARTTALVSTAEQRSIAARRAAAATTMAQHAKAGRYFQGPSEPPGGRIPRASPTGSVV